MGVIDPAISGTTACIGVAIDHAGQVWIYNEYYEQNKRVDEVCDTIREWKIPNWLIDPASKAKNIVKSGNIYSLFDEYSDHGIHPVAGENDVDAGINRVAEYFRAERIKIFRTCENLIWELERYHWSEEKETVNGIVKSKPYKKNDHLCDCTRYAIMSRPSKAIQPKNKTCERKSYMWWKQYDKPKNVKVGIRA